MARADPSIINEDIQAPVRLFDVLGCCVYGIIVGHIDLNGCDGPLDGKCIERRGSLQAFGNVSTAKQDVVFWGREEEVFGGFEANPLVCTYGPTEISFV